MVKATNCATIHSRRICLALLLSSFLAAHSFVSQTSPRKTSTYCSATISKSGLSANSASSLDPAAHFHSDMHRVLESRQNLASASSQPLCPMERRKRPELLSSDIDGAERVAGMLQHMVEIGVANEESYQIVLQALVNRGRLRWRRLDGSSIVCAADEVGMLMNDLWQRQDGRVSTETCNLALKAYAVCATPRGKRQYAQKAQALLDRMEEYDIPISDESFCHVIHSWAWQQENLKSGECAEMAQLNFDRLEEVSTDKEVLLESYHWLLEAWSKAFSKRSSERAESIFNKMRELARANPNSSFPNAQSCSNVVLAWAKNRDKESAEKAERMLLEVVEDFKQGRFPANTEPELIAFNSVVSAWAKARRADKAEEILWMADELRSTCPSLVPDVISFNTVLHACVLTKHKEKALDKILSIVEHMEKAVDQPAVRPNGFTYNVVLKAWVQSGRSDSVVQAEQILQKMNDLFKNGNKAAEPLTRHYNVVINAMAKSQKDKIDAQKAYGLLLQMQASRNPPDIISYTSVIECFAKSKHPQAAEISLELLEQAKDVYAETQNSDMMPNLRTYTMTISALSSNPTLDTVLKARDLLVELEELCQESQDDDGLRPNGFPYNYLLNCAANCIGSSQDKIRAFQVATQTYQTLRKSSILDPDSFTYAFWFKCCNNLLPNGDLRTKGIKYAFDQCKTDGLVSSETLRRLLAGSPPELIIELFDLKPNTPPAVYRRLSLEDVPPAWSRNVR